MILTICHINHIKQYAISRVSGNWFISQIPDFLISQNPDFFSIRKIHFFFISQNPDLQACDLFSDIENSPLEYTLFLLSECLITSYVYLCLIFTIG